MKLILFNIFHIVSYTLKGWKQQKTKPHRPEKQEKVYLLDIDDGGSGCSVFCT